MKSFYNENKQALLTDNNRKKESLECVNTSQQWYVIGLAEGSLNISFLTRLP